MRLNEERMRALAAAYGGLPGGGPANEGALLSYTAFRAEVVSQFNGLPVRAEGWKGEGQPYKGSREMFEDVAENGRLMVFEGGEEHPFLKRAENVMFRAVHDYYGHFRGRFQWGPLGEFRAWRAHVRMFSEGAKPALTAETLGQAAWVNFGPYSHLAARERPYAEQKANLLPRGLWESLQTGENDD